MAVLRNETPDQIQWSSLIIKYFLVSQEEKYKKIWIIRQGRNEKLIQELNDAADKFIEELAHIIRKIKELI